MTPKYKIGSFKSCPVCGQKRAYDTGRPTSHRIVNWIGHIKSKARSEVFDVAFFDDSKRQIPHFKWLKKNTTVIPANKIVMKKQ